MLSILLDKTERSDTTIGNSQFDSGVAGLGMESLNTNGNEGWKIPRQLKAPKHLLKESRTTRISERNWRGEIRWRNE